MAKPKKKKSILTRWWFWVIIAALILIGIGGGASKSTPATTPAPSVAADAPAQSPALSFTLSASDPGEYGKPLTLNAGTENEYTFNCFYIPAGNYTVHYDAQSGAEQITFCKEGTAVNEDGIEEIIQAEQKPIVAMAGESYSFSIADGEYIKLSDSATNLVFEKTE